MHEFAICQQIVTAAVAEVERLDPQPTRVASIRVVIGALHQIVPDYLQGAYEVLTKETGLAGSALELCFLPVTVQCGDCGWIGPIDPPVFSCGQCGEFHVDVQQGQELYLDRLEVENDGET